VAAGLPGHPDGPEHGLELRAVPALARGDHDGQRLLALLARQVDLGGQADAGAAQAVIIRLVLDPGGRLGLQIPLFRAPAACWCARATVESTETSQVISPAASARACSAVTMPRQVPSRCQRRNSPYTDSQGPYKGGTSGHGAPVRTRHQIPSISCRFVQVTGRPGFLPAAAPAPAPPIAHRSGHGGRSPVR
jgi:hypothetical protein